jgi:hypothetical protein
MPRSLFRRSLAIGERLRGPEGYYVSTALQNLGIVARERRDYVAAEADYTRALSIRERMVGPTHPDVAQLLNNLAKHLPRDRRRRPSARDASARCASGRPLAVRTSEAR